MVNTTVQSGGTFIFDGAAVQNLTVASGGTEVVGGPFTFFGLTAVQTGIQIQDNKVTNGVIEIVTSGAYTDHGSILSGGTELVSGGGTANNTTVSSGGVQQVASGGLSVSGTVSSGGSLIVSAGGTGSIISVGADGAGQVSGLLISSFVNGGVVGILAGGSGGMDNVGGGTDASGLVLGRLAVSAGGSTTSTTVSAGGFEDVLNGGVATGTTVSGGMVLRDLITPAPAGGQFISMGGSATRTTVSSGGSEVVFSGGLAGSATISSGGTQHVTSGGSAVSATVLDGGTDLVEFTGHSDGAGISSGGSQVVFGLTKDTTVSSGGSQSVSSGGAATFDIIGSGGHVTIFDHGTTGSALVNSGGFLFVSGGSAVNTVVNEGLEVASNGGVSIGALVQSGGKEVASSGGVLSATQILDGGSAILSAGGTGSYADVMSGGVETVYGTAVQTTVRDGGVQRVLSAGYETHTQVFAGGSDILSSGGTSRDTVLVSAGETVSAGGTSFTTSATFGSTQTVSSGGTAISTTVLGSTQIVRSGAATIGTDIALGTEYVSAGGISTQTDIAGDGIMIVQGTAYAATVEAGGQLKVSAGGRAANATVKTGGTALVLAGGQADDIVVQNGGLLIGCKGANINMPIIQAGGEQVDGVSDPTLSAHVESGGLLVVQSGGEADGTIVDSGGVLVIQAGALTTGTVAAAGAVIISAGVAVRRAAGVVQTDPAGTAGVVLGTFEAELVLQSGTATGTVVGSGAVATVYLGGSATGTDVQSGGTLAYQAGGTIAGTTLERGGALDITGLAYTSGGTATLGPNGVLVQEGGTSAFVSLANSYTGEFFRLAPDAFGGTTVVADAVPCYCRGTLILTPAGEVAVEDLTIGGAVVTASGTVRPIRWIGRRSYAGAFAVGNPDVLPVLFRAGSLGDGLPRRDLQVSPLHAMFLDGALIPAELLVNGRTILRAAGVDAVHYVHIELDSHDLLLAEGAPSESFVDDDSRGMFHNAAEHRTLYPDVPAAPARYCAPRLEDGEALEAVRARLAGPAPVPHHGPIQGFLDSADRTLVTGWARDPTQPSAPVRLQVLANGAVLGEILADAHRPDLEAAGYGDGCHSFIFPMPGGLAPHRSQVIEVRRAADGLALGRSPMVLEAEPPMGVPTSPEPAAPFAGVLDHAERDRILGWAWEPGTDAPVALQVLCNGLPLARVLANRHRPDLRAAGIGNGRHGFDITVPGGLSPLTRHVLEVRRESDGAALPGTPVAIEPVDRFDPALEGAVAAAVAGLAGDRGGNGEDAGQVQRVLSFLLGQADRLLQSRAQADAGATGRHSLQQFRRRWGPQAELAGAAALPGGGLRALIIDMRLPAAGRDAGSEAVLSHMQAMQGLGYSVSLVGADDLAGADPALDALGVACLGRPVYASVEDVLRRQAGCFDVVYLHRAPVAARYLHLARVYQPRARIVFSVADLHHLRLERQAAVEDRPELLAASRAMRLQECTAAWGADAVITHSEAEAALLRQAVPSARVHVVPWAVKTRVGPQPGFAGRSGVAFIGHGGHAPNRDAAHWLVEAVMPMVWQADPGIACLLAGSALPSDVQALARPGVEVLGWAADLQSVFDRVRLTIAPLRYGAGVKGKVLASLAARVPCVMTPVAAEGLPLTPALRALIGQDAAGLAALVVALHGDERRSQGAARAGTALLRRICSESAVEQALAAALGVATPTNPAVQVAG